MEYFAIVEPFARADRNDFCCFLFFLCRVGKDDSAFHRFLLPPAAGRGLGCLRVSSVVFFQFVGP